MRQILGKSLDLLGLGAFGAAHAQRKADHDFLYAILADHPVKIGEVVFLILPMQRIQTLSRHAQRVGDGNSDTPQAYVKSEYAGFRGLHVSDYRGRWRYLTLLRRFAPLDRRWRLSLHLYCWCSFSALR